MPSTPENHKKRVAMRGRKLALCLLAVWILTTLAVAAQPASSAGSLPEGVEKLSSVEGITEYRLANGLRVLMFPDASKETITVNITYLVGSRHEGYGESGMAHLLEHLVFKGTPDHPDIPQELTAHGCRPNGTTWFDRTNYFETFAADEGNLDWALDLEADRMVNSFISKEHLESEFSVVRNEFEVGENYPQSVLMDRMMSAAYLWHNYGNSTIGSRADIERVPIDNLKAFYKKWYRPDNTVLVLAGKFDEPQALAKVAGTFGAIPRPADPIPSTYTVEPAQDGERSVTLRRVGDVQLAGVLYHVPAGSHADFAAVDLLTFILSDRPSGRLYKSLVETQKASSVFGWAYQLREPGAALLFAEVREEKSIEDARDTLLRTIDDLAQNPPTQAEVERARDNRLKGWETTMRNSEWAAIELSEWSAMGDWRLMFLHRDRLKAVTPQDVQRVADTYFRPENRTVGLYIPTDEPMRADVPQPPDVAALVRDYTGGEAMAMGEAFDASPSAIEARVVRSKIAPGIKLAMVPKKTRGATVQVSMRFNMGDEKSLQGRSTAGSLAGSMLMRGTKSRTRQEIEDEIDRLKAQVRVDGGPTAAFASIETTRENLPEILRLVAEILREPSFPESEFELLRQEWLAAFEDSKTDPFQVASTALQKHLNPWPESDPRYVETPDESIAATKAATLDQVKSFHPEFYGASAGEVAIVGDFDPQEVESLLGQLFKGWKSKQPFTRLSDPYRKRPAIAESLETPDKESAVFMAGLPLDIRDNAQEYPALVLGNFMTGGGFLNSRLATRIRQNEGISYGVGSFFYASAFENDGYFGSYAIYAPQNAELLVRAYKEEITKVLEAGFEPEEIAEAKQGWLQSRRVSRSTDRELARTLASREHEGRTLSWDEKIDSVIDSLTNDEIVAAMKKFLDVGKISIVQAGDFAKAAEMKKKAEEGAAVR
jgi:zinc protease